LTELQLEAEFLSHSDSFARQPIDPAVGNSFGGYSELGTRRKVLSGRSFSHGTRWWRLHARTPTAAGWRHAKSQVFKIGLLSFSFSQTPCCFILWSLVSSIFAEMRNSKLDRPLNHTADHVQHCMQISLVTS